MSEYNLVAIKLSVSS